MFEVIRKFFSDQAFFEASASRLWSLIRALLGGLSLGVTTGQINLGQVLGPKAYWAGPIGLALALYMRSAPTSLQQLNTASPADLSEVKQKIASAPQNGGTLP